jgi:hypothetical protein
VSDEDVTAVTEAVRKLVPEVKVVRVSKGDIIATGAAGPNAGVIAGVIRGKLGEMEF